MVKRFQALWVLAVLLALLTCCFARLVAAPRSLLVDGERPSADDLQRPYDRTVGNDLTRLFLPHHLRIAHEVAQRGSFGFWDSFGFGGRPRAGNPQAGLWYPPVWLVWWSGEPAALGWLTVAHLFWGGIGTYLLARTLGLGRWPAVVAAGCFESAPYLLAQAFEGHSPHVWAASWYPWAFGAAVLMRRGDWRGTFALPPILALTLCAGHPQEWYYLIFTLGVWAASDAAVAVHQMVSWRRSRRQAAAEPGQAGARGAALLAQSTRPWASQWGQADQAAEGPATAADGRVVRADAANEPAPHRASAVAGESESERRAGMVAATALGAQVASQGGSAGAMAAVENRAERTGTLAHSRGPRSGEAFGTDVSSAAIAPVRASAPPALRVVSWLAVFVAAAGLAAVELVPDLKAREWMPRSGLSLNRASHYHPNALNLVQLLDPFALGGPADHIGHDNYWETVCSMGLVPLVLAVIAVTRSPRRRLVRAWAMVALLALLFAAGRRLGLFAVLFEVVPGMNQFRVPARSLFLASLGAALLAGLGLEVIAGSAAERKTEWMSTAKRFRRIGVMLMIGLAIGQLLAWRVGGVRPTRPGSTRMLVRVQHHAGLSERARFALGAARIVHEPVFWLALAGCGASLYWLARRPSAGRAVSLAIGVLALVELGAYGHAVIRTAPASQFLGPDPVSASLARLSPPGAYRIRARDAYYSDLRAVQHGFEKTNVNDFFQVRHAADLYENLYPIFAEALPQDPRYPEALAQERQRRLLSQHVLDRMSVALLVTDHPEPNARWPLGERGTWNGASYLVYQNPTALPRAYVVPRAHAAPADASALNLLPEVDPHEAVLMVADPLGAEGARGSRQPFTPASYEAADPDHETVRVATQAPGLLVVADTWMPGWSAVVDGRPTPVLRGNHAQRVIPITRPGDHTVELRYHPPGLALGSAITAGAALVWALGLACVGFVSSRRRNRLYGS